MGKSSVLALSSIDDDDDDDAEVDDKESLGQSDWRSCKKVEQSLRVTIVSNRTRSINGILYMTAFRKLARTDRCSDTPLKGQRQDEDDQIFHPTLVNTECN
jgi:hypothetical protein